ncbi:MAG: AAA family ATPase [Patescibacteria group bacterium]|mgnify:FL=1
MKLIIINGPCGIGKSTTAKNLHESMPLSYLVDVDAIGRNISHYREYQEERWELREAVAFATVDAVLSVGRDVIVEKMIFGEDVLNKYQEIGERYGADIVEIILWASKEFVMRRADDRGWREDGLLTPKKCENFWEKMDEVKNKRSDAVIVDVTDMDQNGVLAAVKKIVDGL